MHSYLNFARSYMCLLSLNCTASLDPCLILLVLDAFAAIFTVQLQTNCLSCLLEYGQIVYDSYCPPSLSSSISESPMHRLDYSDAHCFEDLAFVCSNLGARWPFARGIIQLGSYLSCSSLICSKELIDHF